MPLSQDAQAVQFAADWALHCARLQLPRFLATIASDADLRENLGKLQELYKSRISERLVKQRILQWMLAIRHVMGSFDPCRSFQKGPETTVTGTAETSRCRLGLPREAVEQIVAFVGDARAMNPMTAELASTLSSTVTSWIKFEENLYIERVLADVSAWWLEEGADLVVRSLAISHSKRSCIFTIPQHAFKFRPAQFIFFKDKEYFDEETHILRLIRGFFSAASPYCYEVECFLHRRESLTRSDPCTQLPEWEKRGWHYNLLGTPNYAAAHLVDTESIAWSLTW
ncbi:unnamed protein product [Polarella glacialis]|uniref:Uncharacterized protein n=1 Tax=Polarella glacialis TaxID=89957 RepID=A0A813DFB4_POLGL|nr:unnamed protein product [Polarella glacialis]